MMRDHGVQLRQLHAGPVHQGQTIQRLSGGLANPACQFGAGSQYLPVGLCDAVFDLRDGGASGKDIRLSALSGAI